jgi:hypothetical protein
MQIALSEFSSIEELLGAIEQENVDGLDILQIRELREMLHEVESALSFYRRVIQGWLDIALSRLSDENEHSDVIESLPSILNKGPAAESIPHPWASPTQGHSYSESVELLVLQTLGTDYTQLGVLSQEKGQLAIQVQQLEEREKILSSLRRRCHKIIDDLQSKLIKRYQKDLGSVDEVIN